MHSCLARRSRNQKRPVGIIHHRDAEFAEFGEFLDQELFTLRPQRLRGELSSGSHLTGTRRQYGDLAGVAV